MNLPTTSYADRMKHLRASEIREILKVTQRPEVISFAGGLPASELLPTVEMAELARDLLLTDGVRALQYAPTEGLVILRQLISERMGDRFGLVRSADEVLVVTGSQQALDLTGKIFIDEGDEVLCESPTYLGAINALRAYQPRFVQIPTDDDGMDPEALERHLDRSDRAKLIYVVPDFQNPSGRRWSVERRRALVAIATRFGVPVIEDAPYAELCFDGDALPPVASFDREGLVVFLGTFSKILSPGLRLGWVAAEAELLQRYVMVKQGVDLHTSSLTQLLAARFILDRDLERHIGRLRQVYRARRDAMLAALDATMPPEVRYTRPSGGLFLWLELPPDVDARVLLERTLAEHVAFVPGGAFFTDEGHENTMRLNFSAMPEDRIVEGVRRLSRVVEGCLRLRSLR
ncbi:MAG TPA: PLP-dependent aminotransferase family protein [Candidatus Sulfomarinibacteraceae bacterium]|nr:PLP-dependent aminotransferase family protein [Candidatus Sulfomarinibacteraceae bacterium]